jgi:hypothetical protein
MRRTPPLLARGIYQLKAPYMASPTKVYICYAIRSFKDLYELGKDVYSEFYSPYGLSQADFSADREENAAIITLISEDNQIVYVPDTYILSYPDMGDVGYQRVILSVDFGILPDYLSFDYTKQELAGVGSKVIGKAPDIELHVAPISGAVTPDQHETLESSRLANIELQTTDRAKYLNQLRINEAMVERLKTLERLAIDNGLLG